MCGRVGMSLSGRGRVREGKGRVKGTVRARMGTVAVRIRMRVSVVRLGWLG